MGTSYYLYLKSNYELINNHIVNDKLLNIDIDYLLELTRIKIGKSSAGWKFCLHIYPHLDINLFNDWVNIFKNNNYLIVNEYKEIITPLEMIKIISEKKRFFKKKDTGKIIDDKYIIADVGLIEHNFTEYIVVEGKTYDYYICEK